MQVYIKIILLYFTSVMITLIVYNKINNSCTKRLIKPFLFYISLFYALLILLKKISGKQYISLIEAFQPGSMMMYLLYLIFFMIIGMVMPVIMKKILRDKMDDFIAMSLSVVTSVYAAVYFAYAHINDGRCFIIIVSGNVLAFMVTCFYKNEVLYFDRQSLKERLKLSVPVVLFWVVLMILYLPNKLYLSNVSDMEIPYKEFVQSLILGGIIHLGIYITGLTYLITEKQLKIVCRILFAVTITGYIQSIFLNGKMGIMNGMMQEWPVQMIVLNLLIWALMIAAVVFLPFVLKRNLEKVYSIICVYISLILLSTWGYMGITSAPSNTKEYYELTTDGRMELSSKHNVLVFVLDWFDWQIADEIFEQDRNFAEPLKDFTWYRNMTSLYAFTGMSIPYLLTDVEWQYNMEGTEYKEYGFQNTSFLSDIEKSNYDIGIYTYSYYLPKDWEKMVRNYSNKSDAGWNYRSISDRMIGCSRYEFHSFLLKNKFWYYADSNFFMGMRNKNAETLSPGEDRQFSEELSQIGIHINNKDDYEGAFRFYHLAGAHPPFESDMASKGKNCLNIVYEYLRQLKNAGAYDNATIIITADQGHNCLGSEREEQRKIYGLDLPSSPILFVKEANQKNENGPRISMAPVSHTEFAATIMNAISGGKTDYGDTFSEITEDCVRERQFVFKRGEELYNYKIQGDVRDWSNWHLQEFE